MPLVSLYLSEKPMFEENTFGNFSTYEDFLSYLCRKTKIDRNEAKYIGVTFSQALLFQSTERNGFSSGGLEYKVIWSNSHFVPPAQLAEMFFQVHFAQDPPPNVEDFNAALDWLRGLTIKPTTLRELCARLRVPYSVSYYYLLKNKRVKPFNFSSCRPASQFAMALVRAHKKGSPLCLVCFVDVLPSFHQLVDNT